MTVSTNGSTTADRPEQTTTPTPPRARSYANFLDELTTWAEGKKARRDAGIPDGPVMPLFPRLAETLGGYIEEGPHYFHAPPGLGKSALVSQLAAGAGCPALIVSTELTMRELFLRQIARITNRTIGELKSRTLSGNEIRLLAKTTAAAMPQVCILDATACAVSMKDIQREIRELKDPETGYLLLVIDSLHSLARRSAPGESEYDRMTRACTTVEEIVYAEHITALLVAERSRSTMKSGGLHAGKGTTAIEYSGAGNWGLAKGTRNSSGQFDDANARNADGSITLTLTVEKNRNGPPDVDIPFAFFPLLMKFVEQ